MYPGPSHKMVALYLTSCSGILLGPRTGFSFFKLNVFIWDLHSPVLSGSIAQVFSHRDLHMCKLPAWPCKVLSLQFIH